MDQKEEKLVALAAKLGLKESKEMVELRREIVEADQDGDKEEYILFLNRYAEHGENAVSLIPDDNTDNFIRGQVAMNILRLRLAYACGGMDDRTEVWYYDVYDQMWNYRMVELRKEIEDIFKS